MKRKMDRKTALALTRLGFNLIRRLPRASALALGAQIGTLAYRVSKRYRNVADKNLRIAYGDALSARQRQTIIRGVFQHFARATVEFLASGALTGERLRALAPTDSFAPMHALLARGKGLLFVTAHLGNWELMARRIVQEGGSLLVVARQSDDAALNEVTDTLRGQGGYRVHPRGASPRALLQHLRAGGVIGILPDQKSEDVFVPFFGQPTGTVAGPAVLALKTGAPILTGFCARQPNGTYRVEFGPEIDTTPTGDTEADSARIMTDINQALEDAIRRHPSQWLWLHDRWRSSPGVTPP